MRYAAIVDGILARFAAARLAADAVNRYIEEAKRLGFDVIELSAGFDVRNRNLDFTAL